MRRIVKWLFVCLALVLSLAYIIPELVTLEGQKEQISSALTRSTNLTFQIEGDAQLKLLPWPQIQINDAYANLSDGTEVLKARAITLEMPLMAIFNLSGTWLPKKITMHNADFAYNTAQLYWADLKQKSGILALPEIQLYDSTVRNYADGYNLNSVNFRLYPISIVGSGMGLLTDFEFEEEHYEVSTKVSDMREGKTSDVVLKLHKGATSLTIEGKVDNLFSAPHLRGLMNADIQDINRVMSSDVAVATPIALKLSADIDIASTGGSINNIKVDSSAIHGVTAQAQVDLSKGMDIKLQANIESIDLNSNMLEASASSIKASSTQVGQGLTQQLGVLSAIQAIIDNFNVNFSNELVTNAHFQVDKLLYHDQEITNLEIEAYGINGDISLNKFEANMPGNSHFSLRGNISHNAIRPKLEGSISFISKDLNVLANWLSPGSVPGAKSLGFSSEVLLIPHHLSLYNIDAVMDSTLFKGGLNIYHSPQTKMTVNSTLELANIDANALGLDKYIEARVFDLFLSDYDKSGETFSKLTQDLSWLRSFPVNWSCDLDLANFKLKNHNFNRLFLSFGLERNNLLISKVITDSELIKMNGSINLTVPSFRPKLEGELSFDYLDTEIIRQIFPSFDQLNQALKDDMAKNGNPVGYAPADFNFFGAHNYDTFIKLNAKDLKWGEDILKNAKANCIMDSGTFTLQEFTADAFEGQVSLNANITTSTPVPNVAVSFALTNINPKRPSFLLTGADKMDGYLSINGGFSSAGQTVDMMYNKLNGEAQAAGRKIIWDGFGLDDIITSTESGIPMADKIKRINAFLNAGKSAFDTIQGNIKITEGIVDLNNFTLASSRSNGVFVGKYDLQRRLLNSMSKFSFIAIGDSIPLNLQIQSKGSMSALESQFVYDSISKYITAHDSGGIDSDSRESLIRGRR